MIILQFEKKSNSTEKDNSHFKKEILTDIHEKKWYTNSEQLKNMWFLRGGNITISKFRIRINSS